jgi:hypothetical protein
LPRESVETAIAKAKEAWQLAKDKRLDSIKTEGSWESVTIKANAEKVSKLEVEYIEKKVALDILLNDISEYNQRLQVLPPKPNYNENPEYPALISKIETLTATIAKPQGTQEQEYQSRKREIERVIADCDEKLSRKKQLEESTERIKELEARHKELGVLSAKYDGEIMLLEQYVAARCRLLEESINTMFPTVKWKLFDTQVNGAIVDTCTCTVLGVPYTDLNNAARINAGLEIINVLCGFYGVTVPVFVDNAESVNELTHMDSQVIRLVVTTDKELRIGGGN